MTLPTSLKEWAEVVETILKALGILAAGGWAYFHYFRGRTYKPRLRIEVDGEELHRGPERYLLVTLEIENKGLSKVPIEQRGTGLRILIHNDRFDTQNVEHLETLSVFEEHEWIELGEAIRDEELLRLPAADLLAVRLEFHLVSRNSSWTALSTVPLNLEKKDAKRPAGKNKVGHVPSEERRAESTANRGREEET